MVADERRWFIHALRATNRWQPDIGALRSATTRIVVGIGNDSAAQGCDRTSRALAAALGIEPTIFPGGHTGFVEDPQQFSARLRAILRQESAKDNELSCSLVRPRPTGPMTAPEEENER